MIVVVEGISASGKTTWCANFGGGNVIPENGSLQGPDRAADPVGAANFWAERNVERWQAALAMERRTGVAVCDTDPLKLHYIWCLRQIGEAAEPDWLLELAATRETVAQGRIGFADYYLVNEVPAELARERAHNDRTRSRRRFELHVRLQASLLAWYAALDAALPGRVQSPLPTSLPATRTLGGRYDLKVFDRMIAALPQR